MVGLSKEAGIKLRQTYKRKAKEKLVKRNRLASRGKRREALREQKKLKTYLGRIIRDVERKLEVSTIREGLCDLRGSLEISKRILGQKREDKKKVYSVQEPGVVCYAKGKAYKKYEFGSKVSVVITAKNCWVLGVQSFTESVHDVLTLKPALEQVRRLTGDLLTRAYVDKGYRGKKHHPGDVEISVCGVGKVSRYERSQRKRRNCIEGIIGHMKSDGRMGRNFLRGEEGDSVNAVLCGSGQNMRKLMREVRGCPDFFILFFKWLYFFLKRVLFQMKELRFGLNLKKGCHFYFLCFP